MLKRCDHILIEDDTETISQWSRTTKRKVLRNLEICKRQYEIEMKNRATNQRSLLEMGFTRNPLPQEVEITEWEPD